jgi:nitroimidazol reductase NimA-like FMN-containing flavoprotein (pyridoxamine 5'-phosphate oxidase superfamily)
MQESYHMTDFDQADRNRVRRVAHRGHYDAETIYAIIDASPICHVGFVDDGKPFVIPTIHARLDDSLVFHGAPASRMMKCIEAGEEVCVTITLLDGLVLARSVFHHSMNYRSAVLFGRGKLIADNTRKLEALAVLTEHIMPGRWDDARRPNDKEMKATKVVELPIDLASAKVRTGGPGDEEEDYVLPVWAGVIPLRQQALTPIDDELLADGIAVPDYITDYVNNKS